MKLLSIIICPPADGTTILKNKPHQVLKSVFEHNSFRPGQEAIIKSVMKGQDTLGILPTGGGKSLCYQVPALCLPGLTIVVSPLISLMKDQVDQLHRRKVAAEMINSTVPGYRQQVIREMAEKGELKLLYLTPERFKNERFLRWLADLRISLFTIDEAHCISEWGHDFRPDYRTLADTVDKLGRPPVLALTATATGEVQGDIVRSLCMNNPARHVGGFNRPNLVYGVRHCYTREEKNRQLFDFVSRAAKPGIIYTVSIRDAEYVYNFLRTNSKIQSGLYHGSLSNAIRKSVQESFLSGETEILVATSAFGMGVNKRDIRFVVHYALPGTLEAYYQETGRAGRDNKTAYCLLLMMKEDRKLQEFFIQSRTPDPELLDLALKQFSSLKRGQPYPKDKFTLLMEAAEINKYQYESVLSELTRFQCLESGYSDSQSVTVRLTAPKKIRESDPLIKDMFPDPDRNRYLEMTLPELAMRFDYPKGDLDTCLRASAEAGIIEYSRSQAGVHYTVVKTDITARQRSEYLARKAERIRLDSAKLDEMSAYTELTECRRIYLLNYFGEKESSDNCGGCDICRNTYVNPLERELTSSQKIILLFFLHHDSRIGRKKAIKIVSGSPDIEPKYRNWEEYGQLRNIHIRDLEGEIEELFAGGFLDVTPGKYSMVTVTKRGFTRLQGR
jgi:ATP-dependent DNA helicase RecQ